MAVGGVGRSLDPGVHKARSEQGFDPLPEYVPRDVDAQLQAEMRTAAARGGFILLTGGSAAGSRGPRSPPCAKSSGVTACSRRCPSRTCENCSPSTMTMTSSRRSCGWTTDLPGGPQPILYLLVNPGLEQVHLANGTDDPWRAATVQQFEVFGFVPSTSPWITEDGPATFREMPFSAHLSREEVAVTVYPGTTWRASLDKRCTDSHASLAACTYWSPPEFSPMLPFRSVCSWPNSRAEHCRPVVSLRVVRP